MRSRLTYIGSAVCCLSLLVPSVVSQAASAITVPTAARDTAAEAKADAEAVLEKEENARYRSEAEKEAARSAEESLAMEKSASDAEKELAASRVQAKQAEQESAAAANEAQSANEIAAAQQAAADEARQEADAAQQAADAAQEEADAIDQELQAEEDALEASEAEQEAAAQQEYDEPTAVWSDAAGNDDSTADGDTDELIAKEREYRRMENAYKAEQAARRHSIIVTQAENNAQEAAGASVDWSRSEAAYSEADNLAAAADDAENAADDAQEAASDAADEAQSAIDDAQEAAEASAEAHQEVLDNELILKDAQKYAAEAAKYAEQTKNDLAKLIHDQEHPKPVYNFETGLNVYQWHSDHGGSGHQIVQPISVGYWQKDLSWYMNTNYVRSHNDTAGESGSVNTFTDTTLNVTKRNEKPKFIVDYSIDVNIPTGKSALSASERCAKMNEDLVEKSTFGEGWKFSPGIDVSWRIGKEDMWTIGTSYSFNGSYDPTSDIANDTVSPGNGMNGHLRWEHAGQTWQMIAELLYSGSYHSTVTNGNGYNTQGQWEARVTYNKPLSKTSDLMLHYWYEKRNANANVNSEQANVHYLGTMLSRRIGKTHTLRYTFDFMKGNGQLSRSTYNSFDEDGNPQYTSVDVNGRTKYTLGVGYDIGFRKNQSISFDLDFFRMMDGPSTNGDPSANYNGVNFLMRYNYSF